MDYLQATKRFNFDKYLTRLSSQDKWLIIEKAQQEHKICENINIGSRGQNIKDIRNLKTNYLSNLLGIIHLLGKESRPLGVKDDVFIKFKPICEELVKKKQLNETILDLFN